MEKKPSTNLRLNLSLKDIRIVVQEDDGKGGKKERVLSNDEILALVPNKPKKEILKDLKKKSLALEEMLKERENDDNGKKS